MGTIRLALGQINPTVGALEANLALAIEALERAEAQGADLLVLPELALTGYPPEDLLFKGGFITEAESALAALASVTRSTAVVVGTVERMLGSTGELLDINDARHAQRHGEVVHLANSAALLSQGQCLGSVHKQLLPNYGVFDERRWFTPGAPVLSSFTVAGVELGLSVCEDLWQPEGPAARLSGRASLIVNVNASPFSRGRQEERIAMVRERVAETGCAVAYVNLVGGQDELVFDGGSFILDASGELIAEAPRFVEALVLADLAVPDRPSTASAIFVSAPNEAPIRLSPPVPVQPLDAVGEVYDALMLGTHDYLAKSGFRDVVIGLSGGIDSTLVAALAVDALGAEHVRGVAMPSRYSSDGSIEDAADLAARLGITLHQLPIEEGHQALSAMLGRVLGSEPLGLTDENLQSRIRGLLLMGLSNARGWIVLTTGNKSEMATGYSTLYGDSAGGFAVIKDCPKTLVYELCAWRNAKALRDGLQAPIPEVVISKAPSAELRPDQFDADSLPPYELLDPALEAYVEDDLTAEEMIAAGFDPEVVARVATLVDGSEYKRRQMPPGVRITAKGFGRDRRMPITNRFKH